MADPKPTHLDPFSPYLRIVEFFDRDETAGSFLSDDGEGGFAGAVYRMAREIDRLRASRPTATAAEVDPHRTAELAQTDEVGRARIAAEMEKKALEQFDLVRFANEKDGGPVHRVVSVMQDGMIELHDMGGYFAPHLFVVADDIADIPSSASNELKPCPFCGGKMMLREALWPSEGDTDGIIHAEPTDCPLPAFDLGVADSCVSVAAAWNRRSTEAALREEVETGWQPIETAPRDGREVLLWLGEPYSRVEKARWYVPWANWQCGSIPADPAREEYSGIGSAVPTHWQPLPPPPARTALASREGGE